MLKSILIRFDITTSDERIDLIANSIYEDFFERGSYQRKTNADENVEFIKCILLNLMHCNEIKRSLAIPLGKHFYQCQKSVSYDRIKKVFDELVNLKYIKIKKMGSLKTGLATTVIIGNFLKRKLEDIDPNTIKPEVNLSIDPIILRDENKKVLAYEDKPGISELRDRLTYINSRYNQYNISLHLSDQSFMKLRNKNSVSFFNIGIRKIFKNDQYDAESRTGRLVSENGRLYGGWWQYCPSELRSLIHIDGRPTVELDYKAYNISIAYATEGIPLEGSDPYIIDGYERSLVKIAVNMALNNSSRRSAMSTVISFARDNKLQLDKISDDDRPYVRLLDAIEDKHSEVKHMFYKNLGSSLMYLDSLICEKVLFKMMVEQGVVVLSIHDSFIIQEEYEDVLRSVMEDAFREVVGGSCGVEKEDHLKDLLSSKPDSIIFYEEVLTNKTYDIYNKLTYV